MTFNGKLILFVAFAEAFSHLNWNCMKKETLVVGFHVISQMIVEERRLLFMRRILEKQPNP